MSHGLTKGDLIALTASGNAAEKLHDFLDQMRSDIISSLGGNTQGIYHNTAAAGDERAEANADASDLPTALTLVNSLRTKIVAHLPSIGREGMHLAASAETIAAPIATDLTEANTLANELKADFNTHLTEATVHITNDTTNTVAATDATDQGSLQTLLNEMKDDYNAHILTPMVTPPISDLPT